MTREVDLLYSAEYARSHDNPYSALKEAQEKGHIPIDQIPLLDSEELREKMMWWNILVDSAISCSKRTLFADEAALYLLDARGVLTRYFSHPRVLDEAEAMMHDYNGNEYVMTAEIHRKNASFLKQAGILTGYTFYFAQAYKELIEPTLDRYSGTSVYGLARMEKQLVGRRIHKSHFHWNSFRGAYFSLVDVTKKSGNNDRLAVASWWYSREAFIRGYMREAIIGGRNLVEASQADGKNWLRYPVKEVVQFGFSMSQAATIGNVRGYDFTLP